MTTQSSRLTRRGFLGGIAASAAAAILAACGGSSATSTPAAKPTTGAASATTGGAPTTAPAATTAPTTAAAATKPAVSAVTSTTAPAATSATTSGTAAPSGSAVASSGPIGTIAPPSPDKWKGQSLSMISRQEYFPGTQTAIDTVIQEFAKLTGAKIDNNHLNVDTADFVAKQDTAVKAGNVQDMAYSTGNVSRLWQLGDLMDVSDAVAELEQAYGPLESEVKNALFIDGKWAAIPFYSQAGGWFLRKDWLDAKGIKVDSIKSYENARDAALEISDPSKNQFGWGVTPNKSGDGRSTVLGCIQAYGGSIASDDGKKVTLNSPETLAAVTFLADVYTNPKYKNMLPPDVFAWDDLGNNKAWLAGTIGITQNAYTLYAQSFKDKNPVYKSTAIIPGLLGPAIEVPINFGGWGAFMIFKGAKNPALAKELAKYMAGGKALLEVAKPSLGLVLPAYKKQWDSDPFYTTGDPSFPALRKIIEQPLPIVSKTGFHFPQTPSAGTSAVDEGYVLTDMMAQIIQEKVKPDDAVKTATQRAVQLFNQLGIQQ